MKYNILSFQQFTKHQDELNHLKHNLKSPMDTNARVDLLNQIDSKTKMVIHHLGNMQPGISEDAGAVASAGPTNVVGGGAIAGTGGKGGEPGVHLPRKKKTPIIMSMVKRKQTKMT
jgi:hypothetical protein